MRGWRDCEGFDGQTQRLTGREATSSRLAILTHAIIGFVVVCVRSARRAAAPPPYKIILCIVHEHDIMVQCCKHPDCNNQSTYGLEGQRRTRCVLHRTDDMVVNKCCEEPGCYTIPTFRFFGGMPARCDTHLREPAKPTARLGIHMSTSVTARANTSSAVDKAREAKIEQTKLDNIQRAKIVEGRLSAWKKWKSSEWGPQARTGPTRATLIAIAEQSMSTPNEVAKRLGEGEVVRI